MRRFRLKVRAAVFVVMLAACTSNDEVTVPIATSSAIVTDAALLRGTLGGLLGTADDGLGSLLTAVSRSVPLSSATSATRTIGSEGGVIRSGGVELRLPRGALAAPVAITLVVPAGPWVEAEFFPHGLKFREPATLRFTTTGTSASGTGGRLIGTYFTFPILRGLIDPVETFDAAVVEGAVEFRIRHFSRYAPAFQRGYTAAGN